MSVIDNLCNILLEHKIKHELIPNLDNPIVQVMGTFQGGNVTLYIAGSKTNETEYQVTSIGSNQLAVNHGNFHMNSLLQEFKLIDYDPMAYVLK